MSRITVKSSTVFVSVDKETRVFRSVDEVPPEWRKRFERPRGGLKPQTILIADRKGREEIQRSLDGQPSAVRTRFASNHRNAGSITGNHPVMRAAGGAALPSALPEDESPAAPFWDRGRIVFEGALVLAVASAIAYAFLA